LKVELLPESVNHSLSVIFPEKEIFSTGARLTLSVLILTGSLPTASVGFDLTSSSKLSDQV